VRCSSLLSLGIRSLLLSLQGDRLSLAGTTWTEMRNSWGAVWELRYSGGWSGLPVPA
jgi:hypothetical protein